MTDGRTDGQTELPWLIQRSALQAMRQRCKELHITVNAALCEGSLAMMGHVSQWTYRIIGIQVTRIYSNSRVRVVTNARM